jgi:hypothetical protein
VTDYVFKIEQDNMVVAKGFCPNYHRALQEASHYAMMYEQDGPVKVSVRKCPEHKRRQSRRSLK